MVEFIPNFTRVLKSNAGPTQWILDCPLENMHQLQNVDVVPITKWISLGLCQLYKTSPLYREVVEFIPNFTRVLKSNAGPTQWILDCPFENMTDQ